MPALIAESRKPGTRCLSACLPGPAPGLLAHSFFLQLFCVQVSALLQPGLFSPPKAVAAIHVVGGEAGKRSAEGLQALLHLRAAVTPLLLQRAT